MHPRHLLLLLPSLSLAAPESFPAANGLTRTLVAKEPLLKNPVSVTVDVDGTLYVTETARRKAADLDIREFTPWIKNDLSHTSVEDKLAFFQKELVPGKFDNHVSLKDHNQDGKVDINDLTAISEKIIRFTDNDGDGVMDASNVFAENFNTPVTGIAAGVFAWRGDVYTTIAPDVWKLRDTDGDGKADQRESIAHGFGLHMAYAGHDMHGLTWGPDGKLYWSIGDKGTNVMSKEGKRWFAPHEGAILRCNPDGTGFEIFARGLRNLQEFAFDDHGNIFGVDNDADMKGERERFVYVTEGSDTGWRCYYQYRKSGDYQPWLAESISIPTGPFQPAYITPALASYGDGPAGFAYNPGTALGERYKGSFFTSEFPKGEIQSFKVEENGASFKMTDAHTLVKGPMLIGINFGPDGALYGADWAGGYPLKEKGAVWKIDDLTQTGSPIRKEVAAFLKQGPKDVSTPELVARLSHADQRVRLDAQWELARRKAIPELIASAKNPSTPRLAVIHSLWGLSQTQTFDTATFALLAKSTDSELRAQSAKWAGESSKEPQPLLGQLLTDPSLRVRAFAAHAIGKLHMTGELDNIVALLTENDSKDTYLRQAGVMALSGMDIDQVAAKTLTYSSPAVRLAAAVAFRRTSSPHAASLLTDGNPAVVSEAARAIYDDPGISSAIPALAELIAKKPAAEIPAIRRSIAANRRLADAASTDRLLAATDTKLPEPTRLAALEALATWNAAPELDLVDGRYEPFKPGENTPAIKEAVTRAIATLKHDPSDAIAVAAADVAAAFGIAADPEELASEATDTSAKPAARIRALKLLRSPDEKRFREIATAFLNGEDPALRSAAAELLVTNWPHLVVEYATSATSPSRATPERQHAIKLLALTIKTKNDAAAKKLLSSLLDASIEKPDLPILLELLDAASSGKMGAAKTLRSKLAKTNPHLPLLEGGDASAGQKVFTENLAAQCLACHRTGPEGSNVGPALTHIGAKDRGYILESIIDPGAQLAPGFGLMTATLSDGTILAGAIKEETPSALTLTLPDGTVKSIPAKDIKDRTQPISTMPPMASILTPREIRDIVEYLATLK